MESSENYSVCVLLFSPFLFSPVERGEVPTHGGIKQNFSESFHNNGRPASTPLASRRIIWDGLGIPVCFIECVSFVRGFSRLPGFFNGRILANVVYSG